MMKYLSICAILAISGCATTDARIGLPNCEQPIAITAQIWNDLDLMRKTMSHNQLVDEQCIERLRARIVLHDNNRR